MKRDDWKKLPKELQDFVWEDVTAINDELWEKYGFSFDQFQYINTLNDKVILKILSPLDIVKELEKMPEAKNLELRDIALDLAIKVFAPIREYIDDVDRLILRLGGKIPKLKTLKRAETTSNEFVDYAEGNIANLLSKFVNFKEERISSNKILNKEGRKVSPNVANWIKDYVHFLGAGDHNSLDRAKYLSKAKNVLKLSQDERANVRLLLISYDDGIEYIFEKVQALLKIREIKRKKQKESGSIKRGMNDFLPELKRNIADLEKNIIPGKYLLAEVDNDMHKVSDLLWDSIGLMDKEKAISCMKLMLQKKFFDNLTKEDTRFASILKRFLNIRYGKKFDNFLEMNMDKLLLRRLFLEMILSEKLQFKDQEAELIAFYLTSVVDNSGQIVYLDKKEFKLKWRDVQLLGDKIVWVDDVK